MALSRFDRIPLERFTLVFTMSFIAHKSGYGISLRWLTALLILYYALLPMPGFCICEQCDCSNKIPTTQTGNINKQLEDTSEAPSCCCCAKQCSTQSDVASKKPSVQNQKTECCDESSGNNCACGCSLTKEPVSQQVESFGFRLILEELKWNAWSIMAFPDSFVCNVPIVQPIELLDFKLPGPALRLHLFLLVILN